MVLILKQGRAIVRRGVGVRSVTQLALRAPMRLPHLQLWSRQGPAQGELLGLSQITTGDDAFDSSFVVVGAAPERVREVLDEPVRAVLLALQQADRLHGLTLGHDRIYLTAGPLNTEAALDAFISAGLALQPALVAAHDRSWRQLARALGLRCEVPDVRGMRPLSGLRHGAELRVFVAPDGCSTHLQARRSLPSGLRVVSCARRAELEAPRDAPSLPAALAVSCDSVAALHALFSAPGVSEAVVALVEACPQAELHQRGVDVVVEGWLCQGLEARMRVLDALLEALQVARPEGAR